MSDDSPLFVSAVELLAHSTELYTQGNERKHKFVVLHLANAIELILKDRLVDEGVSIYQSNKPSTLTIWQTFKKLEGVGIKIPEQPVIELLIDDRNAIQHRFGFPDAQTVYFYLKRVIAFFKRFLDEEYGVDLSDTLRQYLVTEDLAVLGLAEEEAAYAQLDKLFELSPKAAVLQAYSILEERFFESLGRYHAGTRATPFWRSPAFRHLLDDLALDGFISQDTARDFDLLRQTRNRAAHTAHFQGEPLLDWGQALNIAKDLLQGLDKARKDGYVEKRMARRGDMAQDATNGHETVTQVEEETNLGGEQEVPVNEPAA